MPPVNETYTLQYLNTTEACDRHSAQRSVGGRRGAGTGEGQGVSDVQRLLVQYVLRRIRKRPPPDVLSEALSPERTGWNSGATSSHPPPIAVPPPGLPTSIAYEP